MRGSGEELEESECLGNMKEREGDLDTGEKVDRKSPGMRIKEHGWKLWHMHELAMLGGEKGESSAIAECARGCSEIAREGKAAGRLCWRGEGEET